MAAAQPYDADKMFTGRRITEFPCVNMKVVLVAQEDIPCVGQIIVYAYQGINIDHFLFHFGFKLAVSRKTLGAKAHRHCCIKKHPNP